MTVRWTREQQQQYPGTPEVNITRGPQTPIEEEKQFNRENEFEVPKLQSRAVSWAAARMVPVLVLLIAAWGPIVFYVVSAVIGTMVFAWWLFRAAFKEYVDDDTGQVFAGVAREDMITGLLIALTPAVITWLAAQAIKYAVPVLPVPEQWSLVWWAWRYGAPILLLGVLVYCLWDFSLRAVAFVQELTYRSPFMEQFGFQTMFDIVYYMATGGATRRVRGRPSDLPVLLEKGSKTQGKPKASSPAGTAQVVPAGPEPPVYDSFIELFLLHSHDHGNRLDRDWLTADNHRLRDGTRLKKTEWETCIEYLKQARYVENPGTGNQWRIDEDGMQYTPRLVLMRLGSKHVPPPHPDSDSPTGESGGMDGRTTDGRTDETPPQEESDDN